MKRGLDHRPKPKGRSPKPTPPLPKDDYDHSNDLIKNLQDLSYQLGYIEGFKKCQKIALNFLRKKEE